MDGRAARGRTTRDKLLEIASRLFAEEGYDAVSIDQVLGAARVSKGAIYHHFRSKDALFLAVVERVESRIAAVLAQAAQGAATPTEALRLGGAAWLRLAAQDGEVRRIVLADAPAVLGWSAWRALEDRHTLGLIKAALSALASAKPHAAAPAELSAHVLMASLVELALKVAAAPHPEPVERQAAKVLDALLEGLLGLTRNAAAAGGPTT